METAAPITGLDDNTRDPGKGGDWIGGVHPEFPPELSWNVPGMFPEFRAEASQEASGSKKDGNHKLFGLPGGAAPPQPPSVY